MGKVKVDFFIHKKNGDLVNKITFYSLEDIDECINILCKARKELEEKILLKKQQNRNKRKRCKQYKRQCLNIIPEEIMEQLKQTEKDYNKLPDMFKPMLKPLLDMAKQLVYNMPKDEKA